MSGYLSFNYSIPIICHLNYQISLPRKCSSEKVMQASDALQQETSICNFLVLSQAKFRLDSVQVYIP